MDKQKKKINDLTKIRYFEMLPNFKDEKTQKLTSVILTLVAVALFGLFAINPTLSTIIKLNKELEDSKFAEDSLRQKIQNLSMLQQKYTAIQPDLSYVSSAIPVSPEAPLLLAQIQAVSAENNVKISNMQNLAVEIFRTNSQEDKKYSSFSFSLSGNGSFENIANFIESIIDTQRVVDVNNFSINKSSGKDAGTLTFTLQGTAYYKQ